MSTRARSDGRLRERRVWRVGEILAEVKDGLERGFPWIWVRGEISGLNRHTSGHWYFSLKDEAGVLQVAMFRSANVAVPFRPEEGLEVTAGGRLTLYERQGRFQLIAETLEPVGWGAQQLAFEQLKERLDAEGLFAPERKRPLPLLPRCVGVVTSRSGAAWRDMTRVWERREIGLRVLLSPTRVQGDGAADEVAAAIDRLVRHGGPEVLIVGRGGGSRDQLWTFNEEVVARAIAASPIPVIAAVGHEIDTTIADLVADCRAATPTAAAEIVAPARADIVDRLEGLMRRARRGLDERIHHARARLDAPRLRRALDRPGRAMPSHAQRLDDAWSAVRDGIDSTLDDRRERLRAVEARLARCTPSRLARDRAETLDRVGRRLQAAMTALVHRRRERVAALAARTEALSPLAVLGRGYSICQHARDGGIVRSAADVRSGDAVDVRLHRGRLRCTVERTRQSDEDAADPSR